MAALHIVASILNLLLLLYVLVLFARMILEFMPLLNRQWRPRGAGLVAAEIVYTITDPPLRFTRRFVRPLRVGGMAIDLAFTVVVIVCFILLSVTRALTVL